MSAPVEPPACQHPRQVPRYRTKSNGTKQIFLQCLECGRAVRPVLKSETALREDAYLEEPFDEDLLERSKDREQAERKAFWAARSAFYARAKQAQDRQWWEDYNAYRQTPAWQQRRMLRFRLDQYECQAKLPGCTKRAQQAHHLTYKHLGCEPLFDLISVCTSCHDQLTAMDREERTG